MPLLLMLWLSATTVLPQGVILVKGATPSVSDTSMPVPEDGRVIDGRYDNAYFGLSYPIPAGWTEQPAGPPPSDAGRYVLAQIALTDGVRTKAHVLVTAEDLFFTRENAASAKGFVLIAQRTAETQFTIEKGAAEVTIGGHVFHRVAYKAPHSGLYWRILSTDRRCHALTFTFTGTDVVMLDAAEKALHGLTLRDDGPACLQDYARDNVVAKNDVYFAQRYNTIPVRVLIDAAGNVKHVHLLTAFPEQSQAIIAAVRTWRFKPYVVDGHPAEVETGMVFGLPLTRISDK
jgi:hypothetical protein